MKNNLLSVIVLLSFINFSSCGSNDVNENQEIIEVLGEWEMYRNENLESIIDKWTGTTWTLKDVWYANRREDSRIFLQFNEDGTFVDRYADVQVANGYWVKLKEGLYYFDYIGHNLNEVLTQRRFLNLICENTFTIEYDGNERRIDYYRKVGTSECSDLITYKLID